MNLSLPSINLRSKIGNIFGWKINCRSQGASSNIKIFPLFSGQNLDLTLDLSKGTVG